MSDLAGFVAARLDEDQAAAKADLTTATDVIYVWAHAMRWKRSTCEQLANLVLHSIGHDPVRVLREVDAKRKILARYLDAVAEASSEVVEWMLAVIETEASIYSDHPDYDPAWA